MGESASVPPTAPEESRVPTSRRSAARRARTAPTARPALAALTAWSIAVAALPLAGLPVSAFAQPATAQLPAEVAHTPAAPYVPSPDGVVSEMLEMAGVGPDDYLIDMGSGDGRIVLTAAKLRGARGLGIEIQEKLVALSIEAARREGVADRARFVREDLFTTDVSRATVVTLYLLPDMVNRLGDRLRTQLRPGARVLSHDYPIAGWLPETWKEFAQPEKASATGVPTAVVYLYRVPAQVDGRWQLGLPPQVSTQKVVVSLRQQWQKLDGMANVGGREVALRRVELSGERVAFDLPLGQDGRVLRLEGRARDGAIEGTIAGEGAARTWRATPMR
jgi:hypothetical protein